MRTMFLLLTVTLFLLPRHIEAEWVSSINLQQDPVGNGKISLPVSGQVVQGAVIVRGNTNVVGFLSYEVDFANASDPTQTWFLVQESPLPIPEGILAVWDTSVITDGDYNLRLVIIQAGSSQQIIEITGLQVRNYTPVDTQTPPPSQLEIARAPIVPMVTIIPLVTSTAISSSLPPTPTPLPTNPAEITAQQVWLTFGKGAAITLGIFAILGAYLGIRMLTNHHK